MIPSLISRREALAAFASTAVLPLTSACRSGPGVSRRHDHRGGCARTARRAWRKPPPPVAGERDVPGHRHRGTSVSSRPAHRSVRGGTAADRVAAQERPRAGQRPGHVRAFPRHAHQRRGRSKRVCDGAPGIRAPVRRCGRRRLAQHAVCRHPECRRLSRRASLPRQRPSDRERRRRRGLPRTPAVLREGSSTASLAACRPRARRAWCRPPF